MVPQCHFSLTEGYFSVDIVSLTEEAIFVLDILEIFFIQTPQNDSVHNSLTLLLEETYFLSQFCQIDPEYLVFYIPVVTF